MIEVKETICMLDNQKCLEGKYCYCYRYTYCQFKKTIYIEIKEEKNEWNNCQKCK